jgi:hypothetical protein
LAKLNSALMHVAYIWLRSIALKNSQFATHLAFTTFFELTFQLIFYRSSRVYGRNSKQATVPDAILISRHKDQVVTMQILRKWL